MGLSSFRQPFSIPEKIPTPAPAVIPAQARLQGCTPAWMQVVEPRLEQAAEVVEPRLEQAAEESSGLHNPFPQRGNDNLHSRAPRVTGSGYARADQLKWRPH